MTDSYIEHQQKHGVAWDIIEEAINEYRGWLVDDDYNANIALKTIMERMQERYNLYNKTPPHQRQVQTRILKNLAQRLTVIQLLANVRDERRL
jgi:hypothetical protein